MKFIKNIIDNWYFKRAINEHRVGLAEDDKEWLKEHSIKINRLTETIKAYIIKSTATSLGEKDLIRKKYWIDCLTSLQELSKNKGEVEMNFLTMKKREK